MERKSLLILLVLLLASGSAFAQRMSRRQELKALKQAYKEAITKTESLSNELSAQVSMLDSLTELANKVNTLYNENMELTMELEALKKQMTEDKKDVAGEIPVALFFEVGKTSIGAKEVVNLTFFVENSLKLNPDKSFTVYGMQNDLAPQRCEYICNFLHKEYGISKEKIINGGIIGKNTYPHINLNRVVIIK